MKKIFTLIILTLSLYSNAQVICGTAGENGSINLTAPAGYVFTTIEFASYGTPNGSCGSFTVGGCHAANSTTICSAAFVGFNSGTINATNGVFGDPCGGTVKRLYIQARYSTILPLTLTSFTAKKIGQNNVRLDWSSDHEMGTSNFIIERSTDGILFEAAGSVPANGSGGGHYNFTNIISNNIPAYYYRLKMVDVDGKYQYSNIVRINNTTVALKLSVFPNPADKFITLISSKQEEAVITNSTGQRIQKVSLINGNQTLNITSWNAGVYFIKTADEVVKFIKK